jgi:hypothetical protein
VEPAGRVSLALQVAPGIVLNSATYQITGPGGFAKSGSIDLSVASAFSAIIGGLPAGNGYSISLTSTATDGTTTCAGSATFSVVAGASTAVTVALDCHEAPKNGSISVEGGVNVCPVLDSLSVVPSTAPVGGTMALASSGHDDDNGPAPLSYQWTATGGSLANAGAPSATFTCTSSGGATVTITISDGDTHPGCPATLSVPVTCTDP